MRQFFLLAIKGVKGINNPLSMTKGFLLFFNVVAKNGVHQLDTALLWPLFLPGSRHAWEWKRVKIENWQCKYSFEKEWMVENYLIIQFIQVHFYIVVVNLITFLLTNRGLTNEGVFKSKHYWDWFYRWTVLKKSIKKGTSCPENWAFYQKSLFFCFFRKCVKTTYLREKISRDDVLVLT